MITIFVKNGDLTKCLNYAEAKLDFIDLSVN